MQTHPKKKYRPRHPLTNKTGFIVDLDGKLGQVVQLVNPGQMPQDKYLPHLRRKKPYGVASYVVVNTALTDEGKTDFTTYRWQPCARCRVMPSVGELKQELSTLIHPQFRPSDEVTIPVPGGKAKGVVFEVLSPNQSYKNTRYWRAYVLEQCDYYPRFSRYESQVPARRRYSYLVRVGNDMHWVSELKVRPTD